MTATSSAFFAARHARLRAVAGQSAALLRNLPAYLPTVSDRVVAIECPVCRTWVKPRRFHPARNACTDCLRRAALVAREVVRRGR